MRHLIIALCVLALPLIVSAGTLDSTATTKDTSYWQVAPTVSFFFSQNGYSEYFKGGGINSLAFGSHFDLNAQYKKDNKSWSNQLQVRYGVLKMADQQIAKNEDDIILDSKFGIDLSEHLKLTGLLNFQTKMHDIYAIDKQGNIGKRTGNFLAPAFINLGSGVDYNSKDKSVSVYYSPLNSKVTLVLDETLRDQYLQNVESGNAKYELGSLLRLEIKKKLMENITVHSVGTFFTNHLSDFGVFDVNIENKLNFKVNKVFKIHLLTQLVYDEDILFDIETTGEEGTTVHQGPRTQFREVLNIGLSHTF